MKKVISLILAVLMMASLMIGCGNSADDGQLKIAIVQQLDHSSLDEIRMAVEAELKAIAAADGIQIQVETYNGQNDASVMNQIGTEIMSEGFDMIIPIATTAAQIMVTAADGQIPVVFAAVSDFHIFIFCLFCCRGQGLTKKLKGIVERDIGELLHHLFYIFHGQTF